ncbi:non-ribosomal peptide synthetase [Pectobacterium polaris]|uniref:non-ribosomal peptide synthetase n=1 Tax=Pectobacterium polaris TaxID=2042057 RepID=UPI002406224C|nr:non-ribosomal peptide synthetase [Pectobacterium polaris]MDG0803092.1 amino acid adenylation domain-containing protein [Pectobacterium polaris]
MHIEFTKNKNNPSSYQTDCLLDIFLTQVNKHPNKTAIITSEKSITYQNLYQQATNLAYSLQEKGIIHETPVAIFSPPCIEQIISQIGILMAKGSCVPLDPDMPENRLNDMLEDVGVQWTITIQQEKSKNIHTSTLNFHDLIEKKNNIETYYNLSPNHRTHILFTSGTTGKPKAVQIESKGILRLVVETDYLKITPDDRTACIANPTFDASLFEIWGALLNGATAVIIPKKDVLNIHYFQKELIRQKITVMFITASLFNLIATTAPQTFRFLRYLLVGGETLNPHTLKLVLDAAPPEHLLNGYGPTESTTFAITHDIKLKDLIDGSVPIGRPIKNTIEFILDDNLLPVKQGEVGHLYIGGDGLSRGYWNRDDLNQEKFINVSLPGQENLLRLYKTGDLGLQRSDGIFMYHGRIDNQIKIRGHRIECEEIEYHIIKNFPVKASVVVLVKNEDMDPYLAAFVVPDEVDKFNIDVMKQGIKKYLPEYMLPQFFLVDEIPLTQNGKADKRQLIIKTQKDIVSIERPDSFNDVEYTLLLIWRNILKISDIRLDENFFQLGGSSLQAAMLLLELGREFSQNFPMQTLYDAPTLGELASVVSQKDVIHIPNEISQWLQDSQLPDDIQPLSEKPQDWSTLENATVLLTGATGFLGAYFLRDLLMLDNLKKVICIIRAADDDIAHRRLEDNLSQYGLWSPDFNERIICIAGDLSRPLLGLSEQQYHQLAIECDVIFHLGAHVNYIQPYQAHRAGNIEGTLNILRLATQSKAKALHYSSTIAVYGPAGLLNKTDRIYEEDDLKPYLKIMKYDSGYSQSQWVVEQFIWEAKKRGIPLSVYRPGFIMGDSINGQGNPKDFVSRLIRGCIAIGAYPILPHQRKEFVPVDYVSMALLTIAKNTNNLGQAYHLVPPDHTQSITLDQFFDLLCESGYSLKKLSYTKWIAELGNDPNLYNNPLMPLLPMLSEVVYQNQTRWEVYENMPAYDASNTQTALTSANSQLKFTPMDKHQLLLHLNFWQKNGFLPRVNTNQ